MRFARLPLLLSVCLLAAGCSTVNTRTAKKCCNCCCNAPAAVTYSAPAVTPPAPAPQPAPAPAPLPPRRDRN